MFKFTLKIENTDREDDGYDGTVERTFEYDTLEELENVANNPEKLSDMTTDLYQFAVDCKCFDETPDDGDDYNGDVDSDINA